MTHPKNIVKGGGIKADENPGGDEVSEYLLEQAEHGKDAVALCVRCEEERTGDLSKHYGTVKWECRKCGSCIPLGTY